MKTDPRRLLEDILEEGPDFRAAMLEQTLRQVRRKRATRRAVHGSLAMVLLLSAGLFAFRTHSPTAQRSISQQSSLSYVSSTPLDPAMIVGSSTNYLHIVSTTSSSLLTFVETKSTAPPLQQLNDEELLALMKGQPTLLVRLAPHQAELLVVDATSGTVQPLGPEGTLHP